VTEQAINAWPDAVFWTLWWASWGLSIWAVITFWMSVGTRRKLMPGERRSPVRFVARFFLVLVLLFITGTGLNFIEILVWSGFDLPAPFPGQSDHPFFHIHVATTLFLAAWGNRLTRGWFLEGRKLSRVRARAAENVIDAPEAPDESLTTPKPTKARWRKGLVLLFLAVAFVLGATAYRALDFFGSIGEPPFQSVDQVEPVQSPTSQDIEQKTDMTLEEAVLEYYVGLDSVQGQNLSSGAVLDGYLTNLTPVGLEIAVHLATPLFLRNSGSGQNMIVTKVFERGGRYMRRGEDWIVPLEPGERIPVVLVAFCVDFDKPNPTPEESLTVDDLPSNISHVAHQIATYGALHPTTNLTAAAQLALWAAQGVGADQVAGRFDFTDEDVNLMVQILNQRVP